LTSVFFHIASALLLFLVLERMTRAFWRSSLVAALFALHPLHVESVAWVAERKDVLSTFFWMLTLWTYVRYTERPGFNRYLIVLFSFFLGLLSKAMLVTLPCVLLLLDYWPLQRFSFRPPTSPRNSTNDQSMNRKGQRWFAYRFGMEKVPFFALAAVFSFLTFLAEQGVGAVKPLEWFPWEARIGNALVSYISYIGRMVWPHPLAVFYPHPGMLPMWQVAGAGLLLICLSVLVVQAARKYPYLVVGWLWYLGTLVPVTGLVQVGGYGMADRFTYVPLIGLFMMVAWGVPDVFGGWRYRKVVLAVSAGLVLSILMVVTRSQIHRWHDSVTLFTHTLKVTTGNYIIHNNLGGALADQGKNEEAMVHYTEALRIKPNYVDAHYNLGNALFHQGKTQEAMAHYNEALRINPNYPEAHNNLGNALFRQGKTQEAIVHYTEALRIDPNFAGAHYNLGNVLHKQGKIEEAIGHFKKALLINPDFAEARFSLGVAYSKRGNGELALEEYKILRKINPDLANALSKKIGG